MNVCIVSQCFYPDAFRINDIAFQLCAQGHRVKVITGLPDYDAGRIPDAYRFLRKRREVVRGVDILRLPILARGRGAPRRLLHYASFALVGWVYACFARRGADVVLTYQTSPVSQALPAVRLARRNRCPHILYCLDLWPESVKVWGMREDSAVFRAVRRVSRFLYRAADIVAVTSRPFAAYLRQVTDVPPESIVYLPQACEPLLEPVACQYDENGVTDFLFAGNVGAAQDVGCLLRAAARLRERGGFHVHIVGDGSALPAVRAQCEALGLSSCVTFYGRKPPQEMPAFYRLADACVLTLSGDSFVGQTLPGKLQSYMSAGKPIVAATDGAAREVLADADCGLCGPASDDEALARHMARVIAEPDQARKAGARAFAYYQQHFREAVFLQRLCDLMQTTKGGNEHV